MSSNLSPEDRVRIGLMAGYGLTIKEMAAVLDIPEAEMQREYKFGDLGELIEKGRGRGVFHVKQKAYDMAKSGDHPSITMFWLKHVEGWEDMNPKEFKKLSVVDGKKGK